MFNIDSKNFESKLEKRQETLEEFFTNIETVFTIVEYRGDIVRAVSEIPNARVFVADESRAILAVRGDVKEVINKLFDVIAYVIPSELYTLCEISPLEASGADIFHNNPYLQLDGTGVVVGIIDTGIDYLNEEFINEDDTSRILAIWDQNIPGEKKPEGQFGGTEYTREDINRAIKAKREGQDPYAIVPSKDEIGHGTNMAGIIGAKGVNPAVIGVAPRCNFVVVKLGPAPPALKDEYGVYGDVPTFSTSVIYLALKYLNDFAAKTDIPLVIFVPLGTNFGATNGMSFNELYIDEISRIKGIVVVVPVGNQGDSDTHTSGILLNQGDVANIELKIDKNQNNIKFEIWARKPDKLSLSIVSPTGEIIERIVPKINKVTDVIFLYEGTKMLIEYFIPEEKSGDERIVITARNIKEGIWTFKLIGDLVVVGRYDGILNQRELLAPGTKFLSPDPFMTITIPSSSASAISVASYNQNNNSNVRESGKGYTRDEKIKPEIAAGGVNATTTAVGGGTKVVSGTSVAAAVIAGCCALIYQWGEVEGNDRPLYASKVKTYLIRGTSKIEGQRYPNPDWGYGIVNMKGVFDNIRFATSKPKLMDKNITMKEIEYYIGSLFIRLPK